MTYNNTTDDKNDPNPTSDDDFQTGVEMGEADAKEEAENETTTEDQKKDD